MLIYAFTILSSICLVSRGFELTILHTNDVHARIQETNKNGGSCSTSDVANNKCFGGAARRLTAIKELRAKSNASLLLDAGDQFQGTLWFNIYKGMLTSEIMNRLGYDAMAIGNHEFDNGISGLLPFLRNATFHVLAANMNTTAEPLWPNQKLYSRSHVKTINGKKVGIIGFITTSTIWLSSPGANIEFEDEIAAVKREAAALKASNVDIIIAVGHAGITVDKKLAENVPDLDIVVGGHSNTFLYTGTPPSNDVPLDKYPIVVNPTEKPTKKILVVQGYAFGKYLGNLKVKFDSQGEVESYGGNPILLNGSYAEDSAMKTYVASFAEAVSNHSKKPVAHSHVLLDGDRKTCRARECNMGNMIADAFVSMNRKNPDSTKWADVSIALINAGGIRASIDKPIKEKITYGDVLTVLPFGNTADIAEITGDTLLKTLEHSLTEYNLADPAGRFLQVAGLRVFYNIQKPEGSRVINVMVRCASCRIPKYEKLNKTEVYKVLLPGFIANGGDAYSVLKDNIIQRHPGDVDASIVTEYMRIESPLIAGLEDRINFVTSEKDQPCKPNSAEFHCASFCFVIFLGFLGIMFQL